jgi:malonyl-CoA O-methyltransferase
MAKRTIKRNFSKNALTYDDHAAVQRKCADVLLDLVKGGKFKRILEVGCGTGTYTQLLSDEYRAAKITAVDISKEMINMAEKKIMGKNVDFVVDDGEYLPINGTKLDLITSNAVFQWFEDLRSTLKTFSEALGKKGMLCFSMYGPETFKEFEEVLGIHFGERRRLSSSRFASKTELEKVLKEHFGKFKLWEEFYTVDFVSLWGFMQAIKQSGARGYGLGDGIFLGKQIIKELEKTYIEKFKGVIATHHVYFCKANL